MNWWTNYPWRMIQTNLRETDMEDINAEKYARNLADFGATVVLLNAAGIIASYDTKLDFQTKSAYLHADSLSQIIDACHKRGIRVIARTDFSKVRYELYKKHPEWAYRTKDGNIVSYNGDVHVCPNGDYQQKYMFEILKEVLCRFPFDGVFCNMSGFLARRSTKKEFTKPSRQSDQISRSTALTISARNRTRKSGERSGCTARPPIRG